MSKIEKKKNYFISYTSRTDFDRGCAAWVEWILRYEMEYETIIQMYDFTPGDNFKAKMHDALRWADCVICILTQTYMDSQNCTEEWTNTKHFVPIRFDNCIPEGLLTSRIYIDLCNLDEYSAKQKLLDGLNDKKRPDFDNKPPFISFMASKEAFGINSAFLKFPINNLTDRNVHFTGRELELSIISHKLHDFSKLTLVATGGFGKSQIAVEYAYRHAFEYTHIWVMNAESRSKLESDYRDFAEHTDISITGGEDFSIVLRYVKRWMEEHERYFFIYENCESFGEIGGDEKLLDYLPRGQLRGHILYNTRDGWNISGERLKINLFSNDEALLFLQHRIEGISYNDSKVLSEMLGNLPLAMEQAVAYLTETKYTPKQYIKFFKDAEISALHPKSKTNGYSKTVATTWLISIEAIPSKEAKELLNLCAYCASEDIPLAIFESFLHYLNKDSTDKKKIDFQNELAVNDILLELTRFSLVNFRRREDGNIFLSIHRLIQAAIRNHLKDDPRWLLYCLSAIHQFFDYNDDDINSMILFKRNLGHILQIISYIEKINLGKSEQEKMATLYQHLGNEFNFEGRYKDALENLQKAQVIREKFPDTEHIEIANIYYQIAWVHGESSDYDNALIWYQKALNIQENDIEVPQLDLANTYNNIGMIYHDKCDYTIALGWYLKALTIEENEQYAEHIATANTYSNIGLLYHDQCDYPSGLKWYQKALVIKEKECYADHPHTARTYGNVARLYHDQGHYEEALECYRKALDIQEKIFGDAHPDVANYYDNIARVYNDQGLFILALEWFQKALNIKEEAIGTNHPDTAATYHNIARVFYAQGNYSEAMELFNRTLAIEEKYLGTNHTSTAITYNNVARVYHAQGNYSEAMELLKKALDIQEEIFGREHLKIAEIYQNMALIYHDQENYFTAMELFQKTLSIEEKYLDTIHPDIAIIYNNIARVYCNQENYLLALEWYQKALTIKEAVFSGEHPSTALTYNDIGIIYLKQSNYSTSLEWCHKALKIQERRLGTEHPDTAFTYGTMAQIYDNQCDYLTALELYQKAYNIYLHKLGTLHKNTVDIKAKIEACSCNVKKLSDVV